MRRLAVQSREDGYSSNKDYQTINERKSKRILSKSSSNRLVFSKQISPSQGSTNFVGFGAFLLPESPVKISAKLSCPDMDISTSAELNNNWNRVGIALQLKESSATTITVSLEWEGDIDINIWGLEADFLILPEAITSESPDLKTINASHLSPETYYLPHDNAIDLDIDEESSSPFSLEKGRSIHVKKCSYCQRQLPINSDRLGSLSFHKHRAKITKHQNECRSCKKWRINNSFNPLRTTDQLHESSVITRERKILLREPEILQEIKDRTGAGLKSQIWEKFNRRCFYCNKEVKLSEFQLDHTRPLAYLWPIDEFATCLCAEHNNQKKDKFPVDFYSDDQLRRLSDITGLPYEDLCAKDVNEEELSRIISDIVSFSQEWDSRTFVAISRKISELRPEIDLLSLLHKEDEDAHSKLIADLEDRPAPVNEN